MNTSMLGRNYTIVSIQERRKGLWINDNNKDINTNPIPSWQKHSQPFFHKSPRMDRPYIR